MMRLIPCCCLTHHLTHLSRVKRPDGSWAPSEIYHWKDLVQALTDMYVNGVANKTFWLGNESDNGWKYGLVSVAAFLAQSIKETIQYDACDENNWANNAAGRYPATSACGQLGQSYQVLLLTVLHTTISTVSLTVFIVTFIETSSPSGLSSSILVLLGLHMLWQGRSVPVRARPDDGAPGSHARQVRGVYQKRTSVLSNNQQLEVQRCH